MATNVERLTNALKNRKTTNQSTNVNSNANKLKKRRLENTVKFDTFENDLKAYTMAGKTKTP